ncbi:hypothetical protein NH340_JMT01481 [Sarcoptes scabiei]|nr:hypothetical protein NH340_JMT01481 [Sarcoptes scabiei]
MTDKESVRIPKIQLTTTSPENVTESFSPLRPFETFTRALRHSFRLYNVRREKRNQQQIRSMNFLQVGKEKRLRSKSVGAVIHLGKEQNPIETDELSKTGTSELIFSDNCIESIVEVSSKKSTNLQVEKEVIDKKCDENDKVTEANQSPEEISKNDDNVLKNETKKSLAIENEPIESNENREFERKESAIDDGNERLQSFRKRFARLMSTVRMNRIDSDSIKSSKRQPQTTSSSSSRSSSSSNESDSNLE